MGNKLKVNMTLSLLADMYIHSPKLTTVQVFFSLSSLSSAYVAGKLGVSDEISVRLKSSQCQGDVRIVKSEQEIQENNQFRKLVNYIRRIFSFFDMM